MDIDIRIDKAKRESFPLYKQIGEEIIRGIENGLIPARSKLPTVRHLADELDVTRLTVHRAYNELRSRGWIDATVGRGTFVTAEPPLSAKPLESFAFSITPDRVLADMSRMSLLPDSRSLAMAEPDPHLYPELAPLLPSVLQNEQELMHYGPSQGDLQLRQGISRLLAERGIAAAADDILVTGGATRALSLATAALCAPGDKVLVEQPTYLGCIGLLQSCGVEPIGVPLDEEGPCLDHLEKALIRERPRFFYTIPSFHNPTGTCMSVERRRKLLSLASRYDLRLVEDDIYACLSYDAPPPQPLKAMDADDMVLYIDSFSKVLLPGLRIGFMVPPPALKDQLLTLIRVHEMCGPPLLQRALAEFLRRDLFPAHLERILPVYRKRRDVFIESMERSMPEGVAWTFPRGGYCSWVSLPEWGDFSKLFHTALSRGVAYAPGEVFSSEPRAKRNLRLCFGGREENVIRAAVSILGETIRDLSTRRSTLLANHHMEKAIV